ncbi:MAG: FGGY family carbohydrate kinase [Candidatus Dormibacteraeota bacterium]|nr:FGGY family carbohydrate kinase [Candidatus Dormibacteraeota bacterium]
MTEGPYLIGIDYGTGGVRVGIFDREGTPAVFHAIAFETHYPRPGWAEQDPDTWWSGLGQAMRAAMQESGVSPEEVAGISLDATSSTVLAVDAQGRHMRPAIMWMDVRASDQARRLQETGHPALKYSGFGAVSAEWGLPKALWLKENEPETFDSAAHICDCADWLSYRLTGEWAASIDVASAKYFHDRNQGGFPEGLYAAVGIEDLLNRYPQNLLDLGVVVGGLRADVAEELGLRAGTPVAEGGVDAHVGALGLGVVEPGKLALITGSSHVMIGQAAKPIHGAGFWGAFTDAIIPGQYTIEAGQASTGSVVAWFKNHFAGDAVAEARRRGVDPYVVLTELAREAPIGSDGLIFVDHFQGSRSPHSDPLARGMIWGLSLSHTPGVVFRAIMEGICYGTEQIFRTLREQGFVPTSSVVSGGSTRSDLWMQMHADIANLPITLTRVGEGPALGSAMLGAVGAGIYANIQTAAQHMVQTERTIEPDAASHAEYEFYLDRYMETYPQMKDLMHQMVRHIAAKSTMGRAAAAQG